MYGQQGRVRISSAGLARVSCCKVYGQGSQHPLYDILRRHSRMRHGKRYEHLDVELNQVVLSPWPSDIGRPLLGGG
jgi:hypothetical protein